MDWVAIAMWAIPPIVGLLLWIAKKWVEQIVIDMKHSVEVRTMPIQKTANGGWSLPDAIRILLKLEKQVTEVQKDLAHLKGRFDNHIEENE